MVLVMIPAAVKVNAAEKTLATETLMSVSTGNDMSLSTEEEVIGDNISVKFKEEKGSLPSETELAWEMSEGSENVFKMTPNASDSSLCKVEPVAPGVGYIMIRSAALGTQIIRVEVYTPQSIDGIVVNSTKYNGEAQEPVLTYNGEVLKADQDYTVGD